MGDYIRAVMAMLRGETPEIQIEGKTRKVGFLNPEAGLIRTLTRSGTAPELRDRIRRLNDAGYDEVVVQVTPGCEIMIDEWARVFEIV